MSKRREFARPIVRRRARFHRDKTRIELRKEPQHVAAADPTTQDRFSILIKTMHLKNVLRDIETNDGNLHVVAPFFQ